VDQRDAGLAIHQDMVDLDEDGNRFRSRPSMMYLPAGRFRSASGREVREEFVQLCIRARRRQRQVLTCQFMSRLSYLLSIRQAARTGPGCD
jgi:hypothetical protein